MNLLPSFVYEHTSWGNKKPEDILNSCGEEYEKTDALTPI